MTSDFNYYIVELLYRTVLGKSWLSYKGDYIPITSNLLSAIKSSKNDKNHGYRIVKVTTTYEIAA